MVNVAQIPNLPAVTSVNGAELFECVQAGVSARVSLLQMAAYLQATPLAALTVSLPLVRTANNVALTTVPATLGGTGLDTYTTGDILYAATSSTLAALADIATGNVLLSGGIGTAPSWGKVSLTSAISGTLPVANGGTAIASYAVGDILYASGTTALSKLADVATGNALISGGVTTAPAWGKIGLTTHVSGTLPVANGGTGVTSSTGTGNVVLSASPTLTGTLTAAIGAFSGILGSAALTVTSAISTSLTVGPAGATNPAFQVDSSTGSQAAGLKVTGATAAGSVAVGVISSGADASLTVDAKGAGTIILGGTSTGAITLTRATTLSAALTYGGVTLSNAVSGTGNMALTAGTTFTGTTAAARIDVSGNLTSTAGTVQYMGTGAGAADTMTATPTPALTAYTAGAFYLVKANAANATTTPTLNISGLGAKTIVKRASTALAANDYLANMMCLFVYDGTNLELLNPVVN
jgi:hypothetical protein